MTKLTIHPSLSDSIVNLRYEIIIVFDIPAPSKWTSALYTIELIFLVVGANKDISATL